MKCTETRPYCARLEQLEGGLQIGKLNGRTSFRILWEMTLIGSLRVKHFAEPRILYLFHARVQLPVALHDLKKVSSLLLVELDGAAESAGAGDVLLRKAVHHL